MEPQELIDIYSSGKTYLEDRTPEQYDRFRQEGQRSRDAVKAHYLFTVGPPHAEWDVVELDNEVTVKMFSRELTYSMLKLPENSMSSSPIKPVLRYLLLTPVSPQEEALKMLGQAFIDKHLTLAILMVDDERYIPIGATWVGRPPTPADQVEIPALIHQVVADLNTDLDRSKLKAAPSIDPVTLQWMQTFQDEHLDGFRRDSLIQALMALPDASFMEAVSRMLPSTGKNDWFPTHPSVAERAFHLQQKMSKKDQKDIRKAPWKTAWTPPAPFGPQVVYLHSKYERVSQGIPPAP